MDKMEIMNRTLTRSQSECTKLVLLNRSVIEQNEKLQAEVKRLTPIPVTAAIIWSDDGNKLLIGQRTPEQWMPNYWQFVGGKVEAGESLEECVQREVMEELGIEITVYQLFHRQLTRFDHGIFELNYFNCRIYKDSPVKCLGVKAWEWTDIPHILKYNLLPVDIEIAQRIVSEHQIHELRNSYLAVRDELSRMITRMASFNYKGTK